jgi:tetratricopeptide (TPR) repeat protein
VAPTRWNRVEYDVQAPGKNVDEIYSEALAHYRRGKASEAIDLCRRILAAQNGYAAAHRLLAAVFLERGEGEAAAGHLSTLLADHPDDPGICHGMARALTLAGRADEAVIHLRRALELDPAMTASSLALAGIWLDRDRPGDAEAVLRHALAVTPDYMALLNNLGSLLAQHGRPEEGARLLERVAIANEHSPIAHFNLANALKDGDEPARALDHYRKAVQLRPSLHGAWKNLGNLLIDLGRIEEAADAYGAAVEARRRPGGAEQPADNFRKTSRTKLRHDIEQLDYLVERGVLPASAEATAAAYRSALADLPEAPPGTHMVDLAKEHLSRLAPTYNRLVHRTPAPALNGRAVSPGLDAPVIEADYGRNAPGFTHVDGFLTPEALDSLRRFCLESTIWYQFRYANGYLGAFMDDGFCCPLLLQIAEELRTSLPGIFKNHTLRKLWAFKYDSRLSGIPIHADFAAVNVNFWITPDSALLDPDSGGLIFWDKEAPLHWDFETYNANEPAIRGFLRDSGARAVNVPHRQNRVVIFNSDLFHETGEVKFREGYENRRINITMLFGKRGE